MKTDPTLSDTVLITLLKQKDEEGCIQFYQKYAAPLYGLIAEIVPDPAVRDELLQEIFVSAYSTIDTYDPDQGRFFTWLLHITRQASFSRLHRYPEMALSQIQLSEQPVYTSFSKLVNKLNPEEKQLISLSWFKGYPVEDVARKLGITTDVARSRIRLALVQLRTLL